MDSAWRWTVFSVFIISSYNNVLVMSQNVVSNRPLPPPAPILRETDYSGGPIGPTAQQTNGFNFNLHRSLERGSEINPQCLASQRMPIFQDLRSVPEVIRPLEPINGRPCPLPANNIQQPNLPQSCPGPLPTQSNTILPPLNLPKIPNNILPYREKVLMKPSLLPQSTPLPSLEQGCSVSQPITQDNLLQQGPGIPFLQNRIAATQLPPSIQSPTNLPFNSNQLSCEQTSTLLPPQIPINTAKIPFQEPIIPSNSIIPSPCPYTGLANANFDNIVSPIPPQYPAAQRPFSLLPPPKLLSPVPNLLPIPMPFNSLRTLTFGSGSGPSYPNIVEPNPVQNPPMYPSENECVNQILLAKQDVGDTLPANNIPIYKQPNTVVQLPQQFPVTPSVPGLYPQFIPPLSLPSVQTNVFNNAMPNQYPPIFPITPNSFPELLTLPTRFHPPSINTNFSSQIIPQPAYPLPNLINNIPIPNNPVNIAAPIYQPATLPPVLPLANTFDSSFQNPIIEESTAPAPINLQINVPPPIITPPKIIIVVPSPPPPPVVAEDKISSPVEVFSPYPMPPIILEGRRSRSKNLLPLFLVALCTRNECGGCGGNYCSGNSVSCSGNFGSTTVVPFPIPIPSSQIINN